MSEEPGDEDIILLSTEDDNCSFITGTFEETPHFSDWMARNVECIIQTDDLNDNLLDQKSDPLLNQINLQYTNDTTLAGFGDVEVPKRTEHTTKSTICNSSDKNMNLIKRNSDKNLAKFDEIQTKVKPGYFVVISPSNNAYTACIQDKSERQVVKPFILHGQAVSNIVGASKQTVSGISKENLGPNVETLLPKIDGEKGLHLFPCPMKDCNRAYLKLAEAKLHALVHLNIKPYVCEYPGCDWRFYTVFKLKRHKLTHAKRKDFECDEPGCGRKFTTASNLNIHKRNHNRPAVLDCPVAGCFKKFQTLPAREKHLKLHDISQAEFVCELPVCSKRFFTIEALNKHARTHPEDESQLTCQWPDCGKVFKQPCRLKEHINHHTGIRPYSCHLCEWSFFSASKLKRHIATHTNERKHVCKVCSKAFLRSEHLKDHMDVHKGGSPPIKKPQEIVETTEDKAEPTLPLIDQPTKDDLLEQAIQSLGVPTDMMLSSYLPEETTLELLDEEGFSTVNLRDLD